MEPDNGNKIWDDAAPKKNFQLDDFCVSCYPFTAMNSLNLRFSMCDILNNNYYCSTVLA